MQGVTVGWIVFSTTGSPFLLGVVAMARGLSPLLLGFIAGSLVDRWETRKLLVVTLSIVLLSSIVLLLLVVVGYTPLFALIALEFICSGAMLFDMTGRTSSIPDMAERRHLMSALALMSAAMQGTGIIGPGLAGIVIEALGTTGAVASYTALFGVALAITTTIVFPKRVRPPQQHLARSMVDGFNYIARSNILAPVALLIIVVGVVGRGYGYMLPAFAGEVLGIGAGGLGLLGSATGLGALCGALFASSLGGVRRRGWLMLGTFALLGASLVAFGLTTTLWPALIALVATGLFLAICYAAANTMMQAHASDIMRSRVMSLYIVVVMGFGQVGSIMNGAIAQVWGVGGSMVVSGVVTIAITALIAMTSRAVLTEVAE